MKLHLGCGKRFIPGFMHVDAVNYDHVDKVCLVNDLSFIQNNSVSLIYASHILEHFKRNEVIEVLKEWNRVLSHEGILRLAVPDFSAINKVYYQTGNIELVKGLVCGRQDYEFNIHYNIFDFESISVLLNQAGFKKVVRYDWRLTEHANVDDYSQSYYPHMEKETGLLMSLNVEAMK